MSLLRAASFCGGSGVACQCLRRRSRLSLSFKGVRRGPYAPTGWPLSWRLARFLQIALRFCSRFSGRPALSRRCQVNPSTTRLGQAYRYGLLGRSSTMLSFTNVMHFLADEFARLCAGRFPFSFIALSSFKSLFLWHDLSPPMAHLFDDVFHSQAKPDVRTVRWTDYCKVGNKTPYAVLSKDAFCGDPLNRPQLHRDPPGNTKFSGWYG